MLAQDHSQDEIVRFLVEQLRAPQDLVEKFVAITAADYHEAQIEKEELLTDTVAEIQPQHKDKVKLPPWLNEGLMGAMNVQSSGQTSSWQSEQREFIISQLEIERTYDDIADELNTRTGVVPSVSRKYIRELDTARLSESSHQVQQAPSDQIDHGDIPLQVAPLPTAQVNNHESNHSLDDPQFQQLVLTELGKRKHDDVVLLICEQTEVTWEEAERFVAEIAIQHHSKRAASTSEGLMIAGMVLALFGFLLAAISGLALLAFGLPQMHFPFGTGILGENLLMTSGLFLLGMLMVGGGASLAYLYYHAAEEHEA